MDYKITRFEEGTDYDRDKGFIRFKKVFFVVDGTEHSLRISMKDFNDERTNDLVAKEAQKIIAVLSRTGLDKSRKQE